MWIAVLVSFLMVVVDPPRAEEASTPGFSRVQFQRGVAGYDAMIDTELWALAPNKILEKNRTLTSDGNNNGGESHVLIRFDAIIGGKPGQIPRHATIRSAKLVVMAFDQGNTVHLHRMLVPWDRSATWNRLIGGVSANGQEALRDQEGFTFGKLSANQQAITFDVRDSVQAWVNGTANYGWVFLNTGGNGWDFYGSEHPEVANRPQLIVEFTQR